MATGALGHTHKQLNLTGIQESKEYLSYHRSNKHDKYGARNSE